MEFKGITWAGNIYQKFEAMCLEVEEVMYQDTVKYVENQAQKVGVSVKKFYSEVMLDLLPPSCVDPVKVATGDLSLNPYAQTDINKKPKSSLLDSQKELKKIKTEDEAISEKLLPLDGRNDVNYFSPLSSDVLVQNARSESCSPKSKKLGVYRRPIGIKRISQHDRPSKISSPTSSLLELQSNNEASCDMKRTNGEASGDMNVKSSSDFVEKFDNGSVKENKPPFDTPIESPVSDKLISSESVRQKKDDSECTSSFCGLATESIGTSVKVTSSPQTDSIVQSNACDAESVGKMLTMSNKGITMKNDLFPQLSSNINNNTCDVEFEVKEVIASIEDNFDMEVIENEEVAEAAEPGIEITETFERSNLEETCVMVEGDNLHFVQQGTRKNKSYKKKIRDALSLKLRSTRKQGNDQCVSHYKDLVGNKHREVAIPAHAMDSDQKNLSAHDSSESEWELL